MIIPIKTKEELKIMAEGEEKLDLILQQLLKLVRPGVSLRQIENFALKLIKKQGAKPSFMMVPRYRWATCININQGVVHGIPTDYKIQAGDLVSIDTGIYYKGFHADAAWTVIAGMQNAECRMQNLQEKEKFLEAGERALEKAIKMAKPGNRIGHLSKAIEQTVKSAGYFPVKELTGHGIGKKLHEPPPIPCLLAEDIPDTPRVKKGMVLAIEIIYTLAPTALRINKDSWTVETANGTWAGLFEKTVLAW